MEVGLHLIQKVREPDSINRETPIVVVSVYDPEIDLLFLNARKTSFEAGANEYLYIMDASVERIKSLVKKLTLRF